LSEGGRRNEEADPLPKGPKEESRGNQLENLSKENHENAINAAAPTIDLAEIVANRQKHIPKRKKKIAGRRLDPGQK